MAVVGLAVLLAVHEYDEAADGDLDAFAFPKADGAVRNLHRREWAFYRRVCLTMSNGDGAVSAAEEFPQSDARGLDLVAKPAPPYDDLRQAISELPEPQRRVLRCLFLEDRTQAETGRKLDLSQPAVSRLRRAALESLLKYFSDKGVGILTAPGPNPPSSTAKNILKKAA